VEGKRIVYRPVLFIVIAFAVTWAIAFFQAYQTWLRWDVAAHRVLIGALDFVRSGSPLIAALILLRKPLFRERGILRFVFGHRPRLLPCALVAAQFAFLFFTFFLFGLRHAPLSLSMFLAAVAVQTLFGGGMEEGGWRAYLQPALEGKARVVGSVLIVALAWSLWHLPYFFLPGSFLAGMNFFMYLIIAAAMSFMLTAIYKLTGSVLLCTLFHGLQNALVMTMQPDFGHPGFLAMFVAQTALAVFLCIKAPGIKAQASRPERANA